MEVFYAVRTNQAYSQTDNGANPFKSNYDVSCLLTIELLREKNTRNGEFRDSDDHNHISIEGTGEDLALKFTHLDTFKSGNWLYKDYNDWVYRIHIAIE